MVQAADGGETRDTGFTRGRPRGEGRELAEALSPRGELVSIFAANGLKVKRIGKVYAPWSRGRLSKPRSGGSKGPFDWICLAERPKAG